MISCLAFSFYSIFYFFFYSTSAMSAVAYAFYFKRKDSLSYRSFSSAPLFASSANAVSSAFFFYLLISNSSNYFLFISISSTFFLFCLSFASLSAASMLRCSSIRRAASWTFCNFYYSTTCFFMSMLDLSSWRYAYFLFFSSIFFWRSFLSADAFWSWIRADHSSYWPWVFFGIRRVVFWIVECCLDTGFYMV